MKTDKFIIENHSSIDDFKLFQYILTITDGGLVSADGTQYCYLTLFKDKTLVEFEKTKYGYKIRVWEDGKE